MTEETQAITVRLPGSLYEQLRRVAYETHKPMNKIIIAAVSAEMRKEQGGEEL